MKKPLIGLTPGHNLENQDRFLRPAYPKALSAAGAIPVLLPLEAESEDYQQIAETFDGFLFTGGPDPHPFLFGQETYAKCGNVSVKRDTMEQELLCQVMKTRKPILGICRGIQIINVILGGTIYQDISSQHSDRLQSNGMEYRQSLTPEFPIAHSQPYDYDIPSHTVTITSSSRLSQICGSSSLRVNSMHHQAVKDLAYGLSACAFSPDGLIEALEMPDYPWLLAVQWHPEYLWENDPAAARLFKSFVEAC